MQGTSLSGVLLRNLSPLLNNYLHEWHVQIVKDHLLARMPQKAKVMDVACGYGRISQPIIQTRPDIQLLGIDFAYTYCQHYLSALHIPSICASINDLPLANQCLDGIIAITAMMYAPDQQETAVFHQLIQRLKPGGFALFIDPGVEFTNLISRVRRSRASTSGKGFSKKWYLELGKSAETNLIATGGIPIFSMLLPLLHGLSKNEAVVRKILQMIKILDQRFEKHHKFTLHRWMLLQLIP